MMPLRRRVVLVLDIREHELTRVTNTVICVHSALVQHGVGSGVAGRLSKS